MNVACGTMPVHPRATAEEDAAATRRWWPLPVTQEAVLLADEIASCTKRPRFNGHLPIAMRIKGPMNLPALEAALNTVIHRHRGLAAAHHATDTDPRERQMRLGLFARTRTFVPGMFAQWLDPDARLPIVHRTQAVASAHDIYGVIDEEAAAPLLPGRAPLMRATAVTLAPTDHVLVLTVSHLNMDGWSARILRDELIGLYAARACGHRYSPPPVTSHFGEFAEEELRQLRCGELNTAARYWQKQWIDAADAFVRHDELPWSCRESAAATAVRWTTHALSQSTSLAIRRLSQQHRVTPYIFMRTIFTILIARRTARRRIALWANFANRREPRTQWMIGSCVHPHIVVADLTQADTVLDLCRATAAELAEAQQHEMVAEPALPLLGVRTSSRGDTRITFDAWPPARRRDTDSVIEPMVVPGSRRWIDLDVRFRDEGDVFALYVTYNQARYTAGGIASLVSDFNTLASAAAPRPEGRVSDAISLL